MTALFLLLVVSLVALSRGHNEAEDKNLMEMLFGKRQEEETITSVTRERFNEIMLATHNELRAKEAREEGGDIPSMVHNHDLVELAQGHVDKCQSGHSSNSYRSSDEFSYIGENLFWTTDKTGGAPGKVVELWYNEKPNYDYENLSCLKPPCGHYTQVVWAKSTNLGCAWNKCSSDIIVACEYGPGGNWKGEKPYKKGSSDAGGNTNANTGGTDSGGSANVNDGGTGTTTGATSADNGGTSTNTGATSADNGDCKDKRKKCNAYNRKYQICDPSSRYYKIGKKICMKTCNHCGGEEQEQECKDKHRSCSRLNRKYQLCDPSGKYYSRAKVLCKKTCNFCGGEVQEQANDLLPEHVCVRIKNYCNRIDSVMKHCKKTCGGQKREFQREEMTKESEEPPYIDENLELDEILRNVGIENHQDSTAQVRSMLDNSEHLDKPERQTHSKELDRATQDLPDILSLDEPDNIRPPDDASEYGKEPMQLKEPGEENNDDVSRKSIPYDGLKLQTKEEKKLEKTPYKEANSYRSVKSGRNVVALETILKNFEDFNKRRNQID